MYFTIFCAVRFIAQKTRKSAKSNERVVLSDAVDADDTANADEG